MKIDGQEFPSLEDRQRMSGITTAIEIQSLRAALQGSILAARFFIFTTIAFALAAILELTYILIK